MIQRVAHAGIAYITDAACKGKNRNRCPCPAEKLPRFPFSDQARLLPVSVKSRFISKGVQMMQHTQIGIRVVKTAPRPQASKKRRQPCARPAFTAASISVSSLWGLSGTTGRSPGISPRNESKVPTARSDESPTSAPAQVLRPHKQQNLPDDTAAANLLHDAAAPRQ